MSNKNHTRRQILKASTATAGFAIASANAIAEPTDDAAKEDEDFHSLPHDIGVYNNSDSSVEYEIEILGENNAQVYEKQLSLEGGNDPAIANQLQTRFIGLLTAPGKGRTTVQVQAKDQSVSADVLMDENGIVEFGTLGIYIHPDGTLDAMWSMA